jgi:hypothetical protein
MKKAAGSKAGTAAALMMFCIFAMSVLTVLMLGAGVYKNMTDASQEDYELRVSLSYIWSKTKNKDDGGGFRIGDFHGQPAIRFEDTYGGRLYHTVIYCYDGWLRELFFEDGLQFPLGEGEPIVKLNTLKLEQRTDGSVVVTVGGNNPATDSLLLTSRSGAYGDAAYD